MVYKRNDFIVHFKVNLLLIVILLSDTDNRINQQIIRQQVTSHQKFVWALKLVANQLTKTSEDLDASEVFNN